MDGSLLKDAFDHHVWATLRVIDVLLELPPEQLETNVPGTYGSILDTIRHTVGADRWYLQVMRSAPPVDEDAMDVRELRAVMVEDADWWTRFLGDEVDPEAVVVRDHEDGSQTRAPHGLRLAQAIHHGTDHRSQICTALTTLGLEPPLIDLWDYGEQVGRSQEIPPTA